MKIKLMTLFLMCSCSTLVVAQTARLEGKITDKKTGEPLVGASVSLVSSEEKTVAGTNSGVDGCFTLPILHAGKYNVRVHYVGYKSEIIPDVILSSGETKTLDIVLNSTGIEVNEVVITAERPLVERSSSILEATEDVRMRTAPPEKVFIFTRPPGELVAVIQKGERVEIIESKLVETLFGDDLWVKVRKKEGEEVSEGWVYSGTLKESANFKVIYPWSK